MNVKECKKGYMEVLLRRGEEEGNNIYYNQN